MEVDGDWNIAQVLGVDIRGVGADHDGLANDGSALADDQATAFAIICAADLAPFTTAVELSLPKLEKEMDVSGVYPVRIPYRKSPLALRSAHELNLKLFRSEQALVSGNMPGE